MSLSNVLSKVKTLASAGIVDKSSIDPNYLYFKIETNEEVKALEQFFGNKLNITIYSGANEVKSLNPYIVTLKELIPSGYNVVYIDKIKKIVAIADESGQIVSSNFAVINNKLVTDTSNIDSVLIKTPKGNTPNLKTTKIDNTLTEVLTNTENSKITSKQILQYGGILIAAIVVIKILFGKRKVITV